MAAKFLHWPFLHMHYNILKNTRYVNFPINQEHDLLMKMFDGLLLSRLSGNNQLNNLCAKLLIKYEAIYFYSWLYHSCFRLELPHVSFLNNYLLLWSQKPRRSTYANFVCTSSFRMRRQHSLETQYDGIIVYFLRQYPIIHLLFYTIQKNVRYCLSLDWIPNCISPTF